MSSNPDTLGIVAVFDIKEFEKNGTKYLAALNRANAETDKFYARQKKAADDAAAAAAKAAAATTKAVNSTEGAQKKAAATQAQTAQQMVSKYTQMAGALTVIFAGIALGYKALGDAAKRLGDTETAAGFTAIETATTNLGDSLAAMVLEVVPVGDALKFMASGITALYQVLTMTGAAVTWFGTLYSGTFEIINKRLAEMKQGKIFSSDMDIGKEFADLNARANAAADRVIIASVTAPEKVASTKAAADAKKANEDAEKKRLQLIADYAQKREDMIIKSGSDILSAEADFQAKSASAWADYMSKSADIIAEGVKKRAELLSAYTDAIASAEADYQRGSEDASYQHGRKLQDIERNYQNSIRQIQQDFGTEALDAARNLDAIGFRRAQEKRDAALADAVRNRDQANSDENENYSRQLYELQRALDDKKREAEQAYQRGLEEQRRAEADAQNSAKAAYNAQLTDAQAAFNAKIAAIQTAYTNEDAAAAAHYLNQETMYAAHLAAMAALLAQYGVGTGGAASSPGVHRRAEGGLDMVSSPTQFIAGEAGPEMVFTMPLNRNVPAPMTQVVNHTGDFSHQIDSTIRSSVAGIDGRVTAAVARALREVLG